MSNKKTKNNKNNLKQKLIKIAISIIILIVASIGGYFTYDIQKKSNDKSNDTQINASGTGLYEVKQLTDLSNNFDSEKLTYLKDNKWVESNYKTIYREFSEYNAVQQDRVTRFVNKNIPKFTNDYFSPDLDFNKIYVSENKTVYDKNARKNLKRPGRAFGRINIETCAKDNREALKYDPPGYKKNNKKYSSIEGGWIYNRCHLIGYQMCGINDNQYNLATGTRFLNIQGMVEYENDITKFVKNKNFQDAYILYYVEPIYENDDDLLPRGFHMMAQAFHKPDKNKNKSQLTKEDFNKPYNLDLAREKDDTLRFSNFNIYSDNYQPGFEIDYKTGDIKKIIPYEELKSGEKEYVKSALKGKDYPTEISIRKNKNKNLIYYRKDDILNVA